jgi:hypothetical protein
LQRLTVTQRSEAEMAPNPLTIAGLIFDGYGPAQAREVAERDAEITALEVEIARKVRRGGEPVPLAEALEFIRSPEGSALLDSIVAAGAFFLRGSSR